MVALRTAVALALLVVASVSAEDDCLTRQGGCSGHGVCDEALGPAECFCEPGWRGRFCEQRTCAEGCSGHGRCVEGRVCVCDAGWTLLDCSKEACPDNCNGHGVCCGKGRPCPRGEAPLEDKLECFCEPGWKGTACHLRTCAMGDNGHECSGHGTCSDGKCRCGDGWAGHSCGRQTCKQACHAHGKCRDAVCHCEGKYEGDACDRLPCHDADCGGHGTCEASGSCLCEPGWKGRDCDYKRCPNDCFFQGDCLKNGSCKCQLGFVGEDCRQAVCPDACGWAEGRGECVHFECACKPGWGGRDCSKAVKVEHPCGDGCYERCREATECALTYDAEQRLLNSDLTEAELNSVLGLHGGSSAAGGDSEDGDDDAADGDSAADEAVDADATAALLQVAARFSDARCYKRCVRRCVADCFKILSNLDADGRAQLQDERTAALFGGMTGDRSSDEDKVVSGVSVRAALQEADEEEAEEAEERKRRQMLLSGASLSDDSL
eukprot:PLAT3281.2.p1 GENE.PLAT3281.2~~PLAT3281.2.p1  ORF type:complete len:492 (+),score=232.92 PLAT3281.2:42-1517(+)